MTTTNSYLRQPTSQDYASPTQFKFSILKLPKVEFFVTQVNIPGITLGTANQTTPLKNIPTPGDKLNYAGATYSDATLSILTSKNNAVQEVRFRDLYPTSLSGLQYDQQAEDVNYLTATVTFSYLIYDFASVGASATTVTTS